MNINRVVNNTLNKIEKPETGDDLKDIYSLLSSEILTPEILQEIYSLWKSEIDIYIENYLKTSPDNNASHGMYKCSLETWEACITDIGIDIFKKKKYLLDVNKIARNGGAALHDDLLLIGLDLYEYYCFKFKKQFFIYDCTRFLGIGKDVLYNLSTIHSDLLKKAHTAQEGSMRAALASGRSNVTAMAILLNHDYDYTRTTQVIHTTDAVKIAQELPTLTNNDPVIGITSNIPEKNSEKI